MRPSLGMSRARRRSPESPSTVVCYLADWLS